MYALIAVIVVGIVVVAVLFRARIASLRNLFPRSGPSAQVVVHKGEEIPVRTSRRSLEQANARVGQFLESRRRRRFVVLGLVVLVGIVALFQLPNLGLGRTERFLVLVTPFTDASGVASQDGRTVAQQLVEQLKQSSNNRFDVRFVDTIPSSANLAPALARMQQEGADALLWGQVSNGGLLDQESLRPGLLYQPNGGFAPNSWNGYLAHFAMPTAYTLSSTPINGQAVLPSLMNALADYGAGRYDPAFATLDQLATDYPALAPALPRMLRGNVLWARGDFAGAAGEYRRTGVLDRSLANSPQMALIANNLGVVLEDSGDTAGAAQAFERATQLLNGQDLGQLRLNLGGALLQTGQATNAVASLEQAQRLLPASAPLLLALAEAYRNNNQFAAAQQALNDADSHISSDANAVLAAYRPLFRSQTEAAIHEQRGLLQVAQALNARQPLQWELQDTQPPVRSTSTLVSALNNGRDELQQAVNNANDISHSWSRRAVSEDASSNSVAGMVAIGQTQRADQELRERQWWLAAINIELGRAQGYRPPSGLASLWDSVFGERTPVGNARDQLTRLMANQPQNMETQVLAGHALLVSNRYTEAQTRFDAAAALAPTRPEPVYGQALVALQNDSAAGRQLLQRAIELDQRFFPAHERLADIAETAAQPDWQTAIAQRRWLVDNYPNDTSTLALGRTLRESGAAGFVEAERVLLPLANANNPEALLELGQVYYDSQDYAGARTTLERAQQLAQNDPDIAYQLGRTLVAQQDLAGAEEQFKRATTSDPTYVPAHLALAQLYGTSRVQEATQAYRAALDAGVGNVQTLQEIGNALLEAEAYDAASDAFGRAIDIRPSPELYHNLARANIGRGRYNDAATAEQRALDLAEGGVYPPAQIGLGEVALQRGDPDGAVARFNSALQQGGDPTAAQIGLGRAAGAKNNWSVALGHFTNASQTAQTATADDKREAAAAQLWIGEARIRLANASGAVVAYNQALAIRPQYPQALFGLAQAQDAAGDSAAARQNLDAAIRLRPNYAEAYLLSGKLYERNSEIDPAISAYSEAIEANDDLAEPFYRRALLYVRTDQLSDARQDLQRTIRIQPQFPEAHYWLGRVYLVDGRNEQASAELQTAIEQRGGPYPEASFYRGLAEEQLGDRETALSSIQAAVDQGRGSAWISEAEAALSRLRQ